MEPTYDRLKDIIAFDETKVGVKGIVDAGVTKVPPLFARTTEDLLSVRSDVSLPVIDLAGPRDEVIAGIRNALEVVGFFQVVNHGIPEKIMEDILAAARDFHNLDTKVKKEYYTRDVTKSVRFATNYRLYENRAADWRDTLFTVMSPKPLDPKELPLVCRDRIMEYSEHVPKLGFRIFELLSEAMGLSPEYLAAIDCAKGRAMLLHYYPPCPEPELTMGSTIHTDIDFLTILLQDSNGGLQVLHQNKWIDVKPVPGALIINIGDYIQLLSNDKFKSVEHRVLANKKERYSVACFFTPFLYPSTRIYGPIKELLSEENPAIYKETNVKEFVSFYNTVDSIGRSKLSYLKL